MPKVTEHPHYLKPFIFHGVNLPYDVRMVDKPGYQAVGDCPLCGRDGKLYVAVATGKWDCKRCGASGNPTTFLRQLWEASKAVQPGIGFRMLADNRKFLNVESLEAWGIVQSCVTGEWLVPGYGADGGLNNLYRYALTEEGRYAFLPTATIGHYMHGVPLFDKKKSTVYLCEGIWDGIALWETNPPGNVLAVPSCTGIPHNSLSILAGKKVVILFDNDHPLLNPNTRKFSPPAGYTGLQRLVKVLAASSSPPASLHYLHWGTEGYDPTLKHGYDVRDTLTVEKTLEGRKLAFKRMLEKIRPVPESWLPTIPIVSKSDEKKLSPVLCSDWPTLLAAWKEAMSWHDGLDRGMVCQLAVVASTLSIGDQLWMKMVAPASTGKTTICEALAVAEKYTLIRSIIRGLHSGNKFAVGETEEDDMSVIALGKGKTLLIKDADTLLQSPNLLQILSELRDAYDTNSRTQYRNAVSRIYLNHRMTVILYGTSSIRRLDASDLGERFLDCVIMDQIDQQLEEDILFAVAERADRNLSYQSNGKAEGQYDPKLAKAMQLTGGYVEYLRENAQKLLSATTMSGQALRQCTRLAQLVAYMRARPSRQQDETAEREFAARLTSQLVRLAKCIAIVVNVKHVEAIGEGSDADVMRQVRQVAIDTARGKTYDLVSRMYVEGIKGVLPSGAAGILHLTQQKANDFLVFLRRIRAAEWFNPTLPNGISSNTIRWRTTQQLSDLYGYVIVELGEALGEPICVRR